MIPPTSIDGTDITGATIDGTDVQEITVDGQTVFQAKTIVDNFEAPLYENQNNTLSTYYNSVTGDFNRYSRQTGTVNEGTTALELVADGDTFLIHSLSGLDNYPSVGDTFRCDFRATNFANAETNCAIHFGQQSLSFGGGMIALVSGDNGGTLRFMVDNGGTELIDVNCPVNNNEWFTWDIDWTSSGVDVRVIDSGGNQIGNQVNSNNTKYSSGGIGFRGRGTGGNITCFWDDFRIL